MRRGISDSKKFRVLTPGVGEAVIRITLTTICGTDLHIVRGEYPVRPGLVIGHEPVGVIEELGEGVTGYNIGDRVLVGAITPCGQCRACCPHNGRNADMAKALKLSAVGVSAIQSMARRRNICSCLVPKPISRKFPTN
jgi:threonine dehydrogenase-like Zn-dependent dehydrogenase